MSASPGLREITVFLLKEITNYCVTLSLMRTGLRESNKRDLIRRREETYTYTYEKRGQMVQNQPPTQAGLDLRAGQLTVAFH
jgi:hypothetical protein